MKSVTLLLLLYMPFLLHAGGQNIVQDEKLLTQYLNQSVFSIDTGAQAIVLYERGFSMVEHGVLSFKVERIVKILSMEAVSKFGTLAIPYDANSVVKKISATTYNLEDGKINAQSVERSEILEDKLGGGITVTKLNLPSIRKGSVIHYTYVKDQPTFTYVPDWDFQGEYPALHSEYEIFIPKYIVYEAFERLNVPLVQAQKNKELDTCRACFIDNSSNAANARTWVRRNVPAYKEEDFSSSMDNYTERIKLHVSAVSDHGITINMYNNWNDVSRKYFLKNETACGQIFDRNGFLGETVEGLIAGKTSDIEKTKIIYSYVRDNFKLLSQSELRDNLIREVFKKKSGSMAGINLLLTAMLRKAGVKSAPVLLSTRDNERLNMYYPDIQPINYLVSMVTIDRRRYFMDASIKQLPFGILMPECYNGYCRVVDDPGDGAILNPDSLLNKSTIMVTISPYEQDGKKLMMKLQQQFGALSGIEYRKEWQHDSTRAKEDATKKLASGPMKAQLKSFNIKNLSLPDEKLTIEIEALIDLQSDASTIYFDPYTVKFFEKSPYIAKERRSPIERPYKEDINYVFNLKVPEGYQVDDYPKSAIYQFSDQQLIIMKSLMRYDEGQRSFSLNSRFTTNTTLFAAEEYTDLRSFYEQVMEEQNKKIVLKRTN